jgi:ribonucleotide monophosphatase NagD (HAD superfamily)
MKTQHKLPAPIALDLPAVIDIYESQRPMMPDAAAGAGRQRHSLIDILDEFDGLILDGFGVINVGDGLVPGIEALLQHAAAQNTPVVVLTNGGSFESSQAAAKYAKWQLPIATDAVVSSRDALIAALGDTMPATDVMGCLGAVVTPLAHAPTLAYGQTGDFWQQADSFALLGVIDWTEGDQADFETALIARPRPVFVANPDVAAPQIDQFSAEPGYWMARAMQSADMPVYWYGKPYRPAFDLALQRLHQLAGRKLDTRRVAMVGDSLHTDILGGGAAGLQTVLITGAGLFRDGGSTHYIAASGIQPDWIVPRLT